MKTTDADVFIPRKQRSETTSRARGKSAAVRSETFVASSNYTDHGKAEWNFSYVQYI